MQVLNRYIGRMLLTATIFISGVLATIIMLTQSLRFLELVISSGASGGIFFTLTLLVLPRFLETILPLGFATAILFTYQKMQIDSELVVMRATGASPRQLAIPAFRLGLGLMLVVFVLSAWGTPASLRQMLSLRTLLQTEVSAMFLRDGVFNEVGKNLMVYIRERASNGEFRGIVIHDTRDKELGPVTVFAKRGVIVSTDQGYQVLVYEGARQAIEKDGKTLQRLHFARYSIDLPNEKETGVPRWQEPDERSLTELLMPKTEELSTKQSRLLQLEIHKRLTTPFMVFAFGGLALMAMLGGVYSRHSKPMRVINALIAIVLVEAFYLYALSLAKLSDTGLILMYVAAFGPILVAAIGLRQMHTGKSIPLPQPPASSEAPAT